MTDKHEEQVRKWLLSSVKPSNIRGAANAHSYVKYEGSTNIVQGGPCHAQMNNNNNLPILAFAGGLHPNKGQKEIAMKFWDFVSDTSISPWRVLFSQGVELVVVDDLPRGFIIPAEICNSVEFNFLKNFCILMRTVTEKHDSNFVTWNYLVTEHKVDPRDAIYLASHLSYARGVITYYQSLCGAHCAITDHGQTSLSFKRFYSGEIRKPTDGMQMINGFFCEPRRAEPFNVTVCKEVTLKGAFSEARGYDPENVLEEFYKWKKAYHGEV